MNALEKVIQEIINLEKHCLSENNPVHFDTRAMILVTLAFLCLMLSLSIYNLANLILFSVYPSAMCNILGIRYSSIAKKSLIAMPFVFFIGVLNPIFDTQILFHIGNIGISAGWVSFLSIIIRGIIATQAIFILIKTSGFHNVCYALDKMKVPHIFTTQLLLVYHYIIILLQEALNMQRSRQARGYGRTSYPIKMWTLFIGQLFLRTIYHSKNIYRAMLARGFSGEIINSTTLSWSKRDTLFTAIACKLFLVFRFLNINNLLL